MLQIYNAPYHIHKRWGGSYSSSCQETGVNRVSKKKKEMWAHCAVPVCVTVVVVMRRVRIVSDSVHLFAVSCVSTKSRKKNCRHTWCPLSLSTRCCCRRHAPCKRSRRRCPPVCCQYKTKKKRCGHTLCPLSLSMRRCCRHHGPCTRSRQRCL